jgi:hypothetical protein
MLLNNMVNYLNRRRSCQGFGERFCGCADRQARRDSLSLAKSLEERLFAARAGSRGAAIILAER